MIKLPLPHLQQHQNNVDTCLQCHTTLNQTSSNIHTKEEKLGTLFDILHAINSWDMVWKEGCTTTAVYTSGYGYI